MNLFFRLFLLVVVLGFASCENDDQFLDPNELRSSWELLEIIDKKTNNKKKLPVGYSASITIHGEDCIQVIGPCNSGPGRFNLKGNTSDITNLLFTERGCQISELEILFVSNLSGNYHVNSDQLIIISKNNKEMVFQRMDSTLIFDCLDF